MATKFWSTPWGTQGAFIDPAEPFDVPLDWDEIDEASYDELNAVILADPEAWVARVAVVRDEKAQAVKAELKALGLSEAAIKYLFGSK